MWKGDWEFLHKFKQVEQRPWFYTTGELAILDKEVLIPLKQECQHTKYSLFFYEFQANENAEFAQQTSQDDGGLHSLRGFTILVWGESHSKFVRHVLTGTALLPGVNYPTQLAALAWPQQTSRKYFRFLNLNFKSFFGPKKEEGGLVGAPQSFWEWAAPNPSKRMSSRKELAASRTPTASFL